VVGEIGIRRRDDFTSNIPWHASVNEWEKFSKREK